MTNRSDDFVQLEPLEKDDRVAEIQKRFANPLKEERGYLQLPQDKKARVDSVLQSLSSMRFETKDNLAEVAKSLLNGVAPELIPYLTMAIDKTAQELPPVKGVLVIYTGGTIGSAPKDPNDPDSPQVVKPWKDLKRAAPLLGELGYPVDAISFTEPLDSCNVGPRHWRTMAKIIQEHYDEYNGFSVLHGTDSMVYTASALSFILVDLAKPVVLTGSQIAGIVNPRNDAHQNIITAITLANPEPNKLPLIPEVIVVFGNIITRGNRCKKMDVNGYQGFKSPNYPFLGEAGEFIHIETKHIRKPPQTDLQVYDKLDTRVVIVEVFPGMQNSEILHNILQDKTLRGVVLKSYGSGNIPTDIHFLKEFTEFIIRGGIVVNVSSVPQGEVIMGLYETSQVLLDRGIIGGFDITPEAALCKLMWLLGNYGDDLETVRKLMQQSLAGEQHLSLETTRFDKEGQVNKTSPKFDLPKEQLASVEDVSRIQKIMLRFVNVQINPGNSEKVGIKILMDGQDLGTFKRGKAPEHALVADDTIGESVAFDLTNQKELFAAKQSTGRIKAVQKIGFSVVIDSDETAEFSWKGAELNIYVVE